MTNINDGGQAFPRSGKERLEAMSDWTDCAAESGMTLRDYFAAHASNEIPINFMPEPTSQIPTPDPKTIIPNITLTEQHEINSWQNDPCWDLEGRLKTYQEAVNETYEKRKEADLQWQIKRETAWRYYFADAMIAERGMPK